MSGRFANTDAEAAARFEDYRSLDPYPSILPALLSSGEIEDYVAATGMLHPFVPEDLKPGSYEVAFEGRVVYWDGKSKKFDKEIRREGKTREFTLYRNSIAFVQVSPHFRLPDYIAIRFNLKITHVYRGLLLGTGPLVDPGYEGSLFIPLHNLTDNDYVFTAGEGLLWMEFTKLAWGECVTTELPRIGKYQPFPKEKKNQPLEYFFKKANQNKPIPSSIPVEIVASRESAQRAEKAAKRVSNFGFIALLAVLLGLLALFYSTWDLVRTTQLEVRSDYEDVVLKLESNSNGLRSLRRAHEALLGEMESLQQSLEEPTPREPVRDPATGGRKIEPEA